MAYDEIEIGKLYKLRKGSSAWSISLQENIVFNDAKVVRVTHTVWDKQSLFCNLVMMLTWPMLVFHVGVEKGSDVLEKANGELMIGFEDLDEFSWGDV